MLSSEFGLAVDLFNEYSIVFIEVAIVDEVLLSLHKMLESALLCSAFVPSSSKSSFPSFSDKG